MRLCQKFKWDRKCPEICGEMCDLWADGCLLDKKVKPVYTVKWSKKNKKWAATCDKYPSLSWLDKDPAGALSMLIYSIIIEGLEK